MKSKLKPDPKPHRENIGAAHLMPALRRMTSAEVLEFARAEAVRAAHFIAAVGLAAPEPPPKPGLRALPTPSDYAARAEAASNKQRRRWGR